MKHVERILSFSNSYGLHEYIQVPMTQSGPPQWLVCIVLHEAIRQRDDLGLSDQIAQVFRCDSSTFSHTLELQISDEDVCQSYRDVLL